VLVLKSNVLILFLPSCPPTMTEKCHWSKQFYHPTPFPTSLSQEMGHRRCHHHAWLLFGKSHSSTQELIASSSTAAV
jgi:hypothetical protein